MSVICKCKSCGAIFPEADIKFKEAVLDDVLKHNSYTAYILSRLTDDIREVPIYLITTSDRTLHCPICEALHLDNFETV